MNSDIPRKKCFILVPTFQHVEPSTDAALTQLARRGYPVMRYCGCSQIDYVRSHMATAALDNGAEETLWIDSDIQFEPDDVDRLRSHDLPIACGLYPKKMPRLEPACQFLSPAPEITFGEGGGLMEIRYAATGFLLVRRKVYQDIARQFELPRCGASGKLPAVPYFLPMVVAADGGHTYLGEDCSFCERAQQCGFKIIADTRIMLGHIGRHTFTWAGAAVARWPSLGAGARGWRRKRDGLKWRRPIPVERAVENARGECRSVLQMNIRRFTIKKHEGVRAERRREFGRYPKSPFPLFCPGSRRDNQILARDTCEDRP